MKRRQFLGTAGSATVAAVTTATLTGCTAPASSGTLQAGEVLHTVIFDLCHPAGSPEAEQFINDGRRILTAIPGVFDFQACRQCSPKNDYQYGFLMRFRNQADFDAYTAHPAHTKFVAERWDTEVTRFQESDFRQY